MSATPTYHPGDRVRVRAETANGVLEIAERFLGQHGITLRRTSQKLDRTFIPGISIRRGCVIAVNPDTLQNHADVLHEAGHLAVMPHPFRGRLRGNIDETAAAMVGPWFEAHGIMRRPSDDGVPQECKFGRALLQAGEQEAMAWSYAAAVECDIDPAVVFSLGYGGNGRSVHAQLGAGQHCGINGLSHAGMTERQQFPAMKHWMQPATMPDLEPAP